MSLYEHEPPADEPPSRRGDDDDDAEDHSNCVVSLYRNTGPSGLSYYLHSLVGELFSLINQPASCISPEEQKRVGEEINCKQRDHGECESRVTLPNSNYSFIRFLRLNIESLSCANLRIVYRNYRR